MAAHGEFSDTPSSLPELFLVSDADEIFQREIDIVGIDAEAEDRIVLVGRLDGAYPDLADPRLYLSRIMHGGVEDEDAHPITLIHVVHTVAGEDAVLLMGAFASGSGNYVVEEKPNWLIDGTDTEETDRLRYLMREAEWDVELTQQSLPSLRHKKTPPMRRSFLSKIVAKISGDLL